MKISTTEVNSNKNNFGTNLFKKRRKRKLKCEVDRNFVCIVDGCEKAYGSENSLNQHIKLKHLEFWRSLKEKRLRISDYFEGNEENERNEDNEGNEGNKDNEVNKDNSSKKDKSISESKKDLKND